MIRPQHYCLTHKEKNETIRKLGRFLVSFCFKIARFIRQIVKKEWLECKGLKFILVNSVSSAENYALKQKLSLTLSEISAYEVEH